MRRLIFIWLILLSSSAFAQYQSYIQHYFATPLEIPAAYAMDNQAQFGTFFKSQPMSTLGNLNSGLFFGKFPLIRDAHQRASIGVNYSNDYFSTPLQNQIQHLNTTLAYGGDLSRNSSLAFGLNVGYLWSRINLMNAITPSGSLGTVNAEDKDAFETSGSVMWRSFDSYGDDMAYFAVSLFGINRYFTDSVRNGHLNVQLGFRAFTDQKIAVTPKFRYLHDETGGVFKAGIDFNFSLSNYSFGTSRRTNSLNIEVNAVSNSGAQLGMQLHQPNFSVGFGYSMEFIRPETGPLKNNAFEVMFIFRKDKGVKVRTPKERTNEKAEKYRSYKNPVVQKVVHAQPSEEEVEEVITEEPAPAEPEIDLVVDGEVVPVITLGEVNGIGFEFNSTKISDESRESIEGLAELLNSDPSYQIVLIGHTDNIGTHKVNARIALQRAQALADELVAGGVVEDRIVVEGRGEDEPKVSNDTEEGRRINRRVEFFIIRR